MKRVLLVVTVFAGVALADIPPPDISGCNGKNPGDSCKRDDASDGTCVKSTCSRNDYSEGPPPKSVTYECVVCGPAAAAPPAAPPPAEKKSCASIPGQTLVALAALLWTRRRSLPLPSGERRGEG